mgnify:CR=1 FL=1
MTDQENNVFKVIDVHEAKSMIDTHDVQIIDSREVDEHESGHVPDSINIPHMETFNRISEIDPKPPIFLNFDLFLF